MGQVPREIVSAKLICRVESGAPQVVRPLLEEAPVLLREGAISFHLGQRCHQDQEIARFLYRHLVFLGSLLSAVDLALG